MKNDLSEFLVKKTFRLTECEFLSIYAALEVSKHVAHMNCIYINSAMNRLQTEDDIRKSTSAIIHEKIIGESLALLDGMLRIESGKPHWRIEEIT